MRSFFLLWDGSVSKNNFSAEQGEQVTVTIYDVAERAGVGIGTVSRAINNSPNIHPETRERVLRIAKEMNYLPHALARSLARQKTSTIAAIVPFFTNYFSSELLKHIQYALSRHHYDLILFSLDRVERLETMLERVFSERRVDGILLISTPIDPHMEKKLLHKDCPIVLVDNVHPKLDSILVNNESGAITATEHLIQLGHRHIGMINASLTSYPARRRYEGFQKALAEHQLSFNPHHVMIADTEQHEHGFNEESGYMAMTQLIKRQKKRPTALFVASDVQAMGVMHAAREANIHIPDDIALVGFDDIEFAKFFGLTTMRQPIGRMGSLAVETLIKRIEHQIENDPLCTELESELIIRESCGSSPSFRVKDDISATSEHLVD